MNQILIAGNSFATVEDVANWANQLPGRGVPGNSTLVIKQLLHFQVVPQGDSLNALVLVETERKKSMSSMVINMRKEMDLAQDE